MRRGFPLRLRIIASATAFTFLFTYLLDAGSLAIASSTATSSGIAMGQLGQIAESAATTQSFQTDLFTGRAQTSVPVFVPPGRKNVQPSLNLSYSSSTGNGWLGMGWALDVGSIQRDTKRGIPKYDSTDKFVFSYQGVSSELVSIGSNEYRAKDEVLFLKFVNDPTNDKWTVTDKSGTVHTFGDGSSNRQTNSLGTFKWLLNKVKDTSGNYLTVTYTTDNGQPYLSTIEYNGNETQSFAHSHKVEFTLEDRDDDSFSYVTGAKVSLLKRLNNIQVKVKDGSAVYQLARKYVLGYEYSTATKRSRLITVTEYGKDGTTSLPATTFVYNDKLLEFESMTDVSGIDAFSSDGYYIRSVLSGGETLVDYLDVNGDSFNDRVESAATSTTWRVQYGTGTSFSSISTFGTLWKPTSATGYDHVSWLNSSRQQPTDFIDINGDGLPDRIVAQDNNTSWTVQLQKAGAAGFEPSNSSWGTISRMVANANYDYIRYVPTWSTSATKTLVDFFDMNGDGLPDRVMAEVGTNYFKVQLNTGTGFASMVNWGNTERMDSDQERDCIRTQANGNQTYVDMVDLNGDGLPDRVQALQGQTNWKVQWNTGSGFTTMENWGPIERLDSGDAERDNIRDTVNFNGQQATDLFDINGDGLPDRVQASADNTVWKVQYNTGTGFTSMQNFGTIEYFVTSSDYSYPRWHDSGGNQKLDMADIDGDGLPDRIQSKSSNTAWKKQKNKGPFPDLLKEIKNGRGAKTTITYGPSTAYDNRDTNGNQRLPFPAQVVTQVDQADGMGNTVTTTYSYKGGLYDSTDREFRGFREVTVTDAVSTKSIHTFDQSSTKKGKLLTKEVKDSSSNLFSKEETTWSTTNPFTGVTFAYVSQIDNYLYDGDASYKQTRQTFTYDSYGNLASTTEEGDTSLSTDSRKTVNTYVYNTTPYIVNTLSKTTLYDTDLTTIKAERYFYYDGATSITTAPTAGRLTQEEEWLNTASGCGTAGTCANNPKTVMTYDVYGNVATVTDARGYVTTNTYDSTYHLFLTQIQNALGHTRSFTYDAWHAQILTSTDANSQVTETVYDTLGRVTKVIEPLDSSSEPTQEFTYDYPNLGTCGSSCTTKTTVKVKSSVPGQTFTQLTSYVFTDGLGREIERRSPVESGSQQTVSGIVTFNSRGLIDKQYVPYFENTSTSYVAPDTSKSKATFTYDAVGRRTRIDYPDSTNSQVAYSDFVKTTTDQRGKQLRYTNDAYGRLVKTEEFNSGETYTTTYEYDVLNNLKKTTDTQSNETALTYDSLSRKTAMTDPDMGAWSYAYDLNDNLIAQTDAINTATGAATIAVDVTGSASQSTSVTASTGMTTSITGIAEGATILVAIANEDTSTTDGAIASVSSDVNGALVRDKSTVVTASGRTNYAEVWRLTNASSGNHTITIKPTGTTAGMCAVAVSFTGLKNYNQPDAVASSTATSKSSPHSTSVTTVAANALVFDVFVDADAEDTITPTSPQTQVMNLADSGSNIKAGASYKIATTAGAYTMEWSGWSGTATRIAQVSDSYAPAAATPPISFTYDALNRVTTKDLPSSETDVRYVYDVAPSAYTGQTGYWVGRLSKVTDASGTHEFKYDKEGLTLADKKTVDSTGYEFVRAYDSMGRVRTLTYPDTEVVTYTYNGFGDVETISGLKSSVTTDYVKDVNYNASGQITFLKYGNNVTSNYTYNANTLRLSSILTEKQSGTDLQNLSYTFDNNGNVTQITDTVNTMSQTFTYDDLNRLTQAVGSAYGTQSFAYDSIGNMTNKAGRTMAYGAGAPGPHAVTSLTWTGSNLPTFGRDYNGSVSFTYDANGNMTVRGQDTLAYDSENRLKEMKVREGTSGTTNYTLKPGWNVISFTHLPDNKAVSTVLSSLTFGTDYDQVSTWDSASSTWKHWVNDADFNDFTEFSYGKTYEIYNKSGVDKSLAVTGVTNGNDLTHNIVSGDNFISPAVKTATNVTTVLTGLTQGTHYSDVKRFNATTQSWESYQGGAFTQFEPGKGYNIIGLTTASFSYGKTTETTTTFVYDSTGQRVKKTAGGTATIYLGKDYDVVGATSTKYIFLGDRRLATRDSADTVRFVHDDHISSSNVITDSSGDQAGYYEYEPYGSTVAHTGSTAKHQFTGQENDDSTKLYYYGARYYDPQLGRFITPDTFVSDPINPQDLNRYSYARNNPVKYTDPTGNLLFLAFFFVTALIGAVVNVSIQAAMGNINSGKDFWKAAAVGATGGATIATGTLALGVLGASGVVLAAGELLAVGASGFLSNGVQNAFEGRSFGQNGLFMAGLSMATFGVVRHAGGPVTDVIGKMPGVKPVVQMLKNIAKNIPSADKISSTAARFKNWYNELYRDSVNYLKGQPPLRLFRVWGGDSGPNGQSWSLDDPRKFANYRQAAGLPEGNSGRFVSEGTLRDYNEIKFRTALDGPDGAKASVREVLVPNPQKQIQLKRVSGANPEY